jgi:hypothetical protein
MCDTPVQPHSTTQHDTHNTAHVHSKHERAQGEEQCTGDYEHTQAHTIICRDRGAYKVHAPIHMRTHLRADRTGSFCNDRAIGERQLPGGVLRPRVRPNDHLQQRALT